MGNYTNDKTKTYKIIDKLIDSKINFSLKELFFKCDHDFGFGKKTVLSILQNYVDKGLIFVHLDEGFVEILKNTNQETKKEFIVDSKEW